MTSTFAATDIRRITYSVLQSSELPRSRTGRVLALTSANPREGVTWVARMLCRELSGDASGRTLYCTADTLAGSAVEKMADVESHCVRLGAGCWTLDSESILQHRSGWEYSPAIREERLGVLRKQFDYIILDCPAVCTSSAVTAIAPLVDAMLLVVAAGRSTRKQIGYAQQVIALSGGSLKGAVLNRRTYPIPTWIYNALKGVHA